MSESIPETGYTYQHGFSLMHPEEMFDTEQRTRKAMKTLSVLSEHLAAHGRDPAEMTLLDIGCSTGFLTQVYGTVFGRVVGVDIDEAGVAFATDNNQCPNVDFLVADSMALRLEDNSFDCVTCTHIYEHVPDARRLVSEIHRVLKPGGICYFAAGNRLKFMEAHYRLPLLSAIPKPLGHLYIRLAGKADHYYETHLSLWGLRRLVRDFQVTDYTTWIITDPERFHSTDMLAPGSLKQRLSLLILRAAYWLCPTYIWILRKPDGA